MKQKYYRALAWAVEKAAEWKGSLMPEDYGPFDNEIRLAREALKELREQEKSTQQRR